MNAREIFKISGIPIIFASLCCLSPIIVVLLGLGSVTVASTLADTLYGEYKWAFRLLGLLMLAGALIMRFRRQGVCTLDQAKRERSRIINTVIITLATGIIGYIIFLYVIVHYAGVWLHIWK
jgi:NADH:ubiquinone oxidoreductase subunit 6 (subunit J)